MDEMTSAEVDAALRANRFLAFAGENYYPMSRCGDFVSAHATIEAATAAVRGTLDWWCVFDVALGRVVAEGRS